MERRIVLAGLLTAVGGASFTSGAAQAQSTAAPAPAPAMKMDMPAAGMSEAVKAHIQETMTAGSLSLIVSRIALSKLKHPMGKQFAGFEVAEQDTVADILKGRMMQAQKPMGEVKAPTDAEIEANLDPKVKDIVATFRAMKEGPEFEKAYIAAQIDGHQKLLGIQETYLKVADDADETSIAKLVLGMVKEHLTLLSDIGKHLG